MLTRRLLLIGGAVVLALPVVLVSLALTACSGLQGRAASRPTGADDNAADRARADLASRLDTPIDRIEVGPVVEHTWPDTSLGLPEPGMMYAEVVTSGHIVELRHDGRTYTYHVAGELVISADQDDPERSPAPTEPTVPASASAERARADLASRLGTTVDQIGVESVEPHTWPDASLGLPEPGMMYAQVLTDGEIVTLSYGGRNYVYHVAGEAVKLNPAGS